MVSRPSENGIEIAITAGNREAFRDPGRNADPFSEGRPVEKHATYPPGAHFPVRPCAASPLILIGFSSCNVMRDLYSGMIGAPAAQAAPGDEWLPAHGAAGLRFVASPGEECLPPKKFRLLGRRLP